MTQSDNHPDAAPSDAASTRAARIRDSQAFATRLEPTRDDVRQQALSPLRIDAELLARIGMLRHLAAPRTSLPPRIARYRVLRFAPVQRAILRVWNYVTRPGRTQSQATADCVDLIYTELKRITQHDQR
ncbi:hypothetical protein KDW55_00405 [Burkholderia sp. AU19243]|uniref:Uncharacterized protein n=1 Tax=Burkholderia latens TaxID=488446 RepID=A0AAP1CDQ4_9BURK|nr:MULTISPECIES: hypothetical protein [Burkholderia]AIO40312.1 hypothetical protein DM40_1548 [Burkholderia cenocepacia]MBR7963262.1 hypothetical protein [Burkholderia vietnamiensis]KVA12949.1 hypothetical protein WI41_05760 [Burkholderia latens]MBR8140827.1 hypothetical protein [Burkholderia vietnamiensis]MBR8361784.1 hypothetical protein [Burkholderia sp. AU19243]